MSTQVVSFLTFLVNLRVRDIYAQTGPSGGEPFGMEDNNAPIVRWEEKDMPLMDGVCRCETSKVDILGPRAILSPRDPVNALVLYGPNKERGQGRT